MLKLFGSQQVKNTVTLGGVVMTGSASSDVLPILVVSGTKILTASTGSHRWITINSDVLSRMSSFVRSDEVILSVTLPFSQKVFFISISSNVYLISFIKNVCIRAYKQSRRKYLDSAIVNCCMWIKMDGSIVRDCRMVFGNMGDHLITASQTMEAIVQREWNDDLLSTACKSLYEEMALPPDVEGGMAQYRLSLCLSFFYKFFLIVYNKIWPKSQLENSALEPLPSGPSKGSQGFQSVPECQPLWDSIGRPMMHLSAIEQATGEAKYVDDLPMIEGELFAGFVLSECAHGTFTVDTSALEGMKGVRGFVSVKDVPGNNTVGLGGDENLFADGEVTAVGQIIGIVVAEDRLTAQRGAKSVKVKYKELPAIFTIEEAISAGEFYQPERELKRGDVEKALSESEYCLEGEVRVGGQEHFYMETCSCICIPKGEKGEMEIIASTQDLKGLQQCCAGVLNIPANRITTKVKRLGGSFGGKDSRSHLPYVAVTVAAYRLHAPVRAMFERSEDTVNIGGRHPFKGIYKVGFNDTGKLTALDIDVYSNGGYSMDYSISLLSCAVTYLHGVYNIPAVRFGGHACRTNLPSNTAMRGFGYPQALLILESILDHVADSLGLEKMLVQELNFLRDGDYFVYREKVENCTIRRCWSTLKEKCEYEKRKVEVDEFNSANKWKKRGISIVPTIRGIGIPHDGMMQAGALVHVYTDGTVLLAHGGVEMGQGLHTKMVQVCSKCLSIPVGNIYLKETSVDTVPNATPTIASISADLNGMAVKNACDQLNKRLQPFREAEPEAGWDTWVTKAYESRINLSAQGFFKAPDIWMDWNKGIGKPYSYYCYGAGCSVVEVDTLTGSFQVLQTDLLMDVGDSLNPAIDIGQIEGAFTQGLGLFTMEECVFLRDGKMHTVGPGTYKIPGCSDIPIELNVTLLDRCPNPHAIFSSKGIGEPPLFLAASVFFAIKEAIKSARAERGITGPFDFWSPATAERIRMACKDQFVEMVQSNKQEYDEIWNITH